MWNQGAKENIVGITSKDSPDSMGGSSSSRKKLSAGTIAGIVVGSVLGGLLLAAAIAVFLLRKRRKWIGTGFAVAARKSRDDSPVFKAPVFNDVSNRGSTPGSSVPFSADEVSGSRSRSMAEYARPASAAVSDSAAAAAGSTVELDGQDTAVRPNTEIDGHEINQEPLPAVAENPKGVFELPGSKVEERPPSAVGSLPDEREVADHSPPSPLTSTFDGTWGGTRDSRADSLLVSPEHSTYRPGDRPF